MKNGWRNSQENYRNQERISKSMKIQFDPNLDFQKEAIDSIVGLFDGQEICRTNFTVAPLSKDEPQFEAMQSDLGIGNRLRLLNEDIHKNIRAVQLHNGLRPTDSLDSLDFTIEMETGTGKTYVYLRTIFESKHKRLSASLVEKRN